MGVLLENAFHPKELKKKQLRTGIIQTFVAFSFGMCVVLWRKDISTGSFPKWLDIAFQWGHKGYICPYCGGTRAFVSCCRGEFINALHFSFMGSLVFPWLVLTLPWRIYFLLASKPHFQFIDIIIRKVESADCFIIVTALLFSLQFVLHYADLWEWIPMTNYLSH